MRGGASGWFDAGIVFIQPAEFGKVLFIIVFAQYRASRHEQIGKPQDIRARPASAFVREFISA